jgi:hypothetical protein
MSDLMLQYGILSEEFDVEELIAPERELLTGCPRTAPRHVAAEPSFVRQDN